MNNEKIFEIFENFILNDYKFGYSIDFENSYDELINYWNYWFINNEYDGITKVLLTNLLNDFNLNPKYKDELDVIFRAHYNSSGNHMILFYKTYSKKILVKIKAPNVKNSNNIPFWTMLIESDKIKQLMKANNIKKDQMSVLVYN